MKKIFSKQLAFGLIETIMASGIIVVVIGSLTLVSSVVLKSSRQTSEDLMANYLIHEVFESARQIRGTNYIDEDSETVWDNGLIIGGVILNWVPVDLSIPPDGVEEYKKPIFMTDSAGSGEDINKRNIIYKRKINIERISDDKIKVEVTISWGESKQRKSSIILTNYEQGF